MIKKMKEFVEKHGYSVKTYCLALILFPPAAHYIASTYPGLTMPQKILGNLIPVALLLFIVFVAAPAIVKFVS